jgi:hypothetical protein
VAAFILGGAQAAGTRAAAGFDGAQLSVDYAAFVGQSFLALSVNLQGALGSGGAPPVAAAVQIAVPAGFQLDLSKPAGAKLGDLSAGIESAADGSGFAFADGSIVVDAPATYAADPVAQACAPGVHAAVWRASVSVIGQVISLPIAVDAVTDPGATSAYTIRVCPLQAPSAALPAGSTFVLFSAVLLNEVTAPTAPGNYTWSALVTPATNFVADPTGTFELRATLPLPRSLTLDAQYDPKAHAAVLSGNVSAAGKPTAGAAVSLVAHDRNDKLIDLGTAVTSASGAFRVRRPVDRTVDVEASIASTDGGPCTAPSTAPGGCVSETVAGPQGASATVIVPRKTDAKLVLLPRDQALARRSTLGGSDVPSNWIDVSGPAGPCPGFAPNLKLLTVSGQAFSHSFLSADQATVASSTASVYVDRKSATTAFARIALPAAARCQARAIGSGDSGTRMISVAPLAFPKIGDAARAFRAAVTIPQGVVNADLVFVRVGRVVIELDVYALGASEDGLEAVLARRLASRAREQ